MDDIAPKPTLWFSVYTLKPYNGDEPAFYYQNVIPARDRLQAATPVFLKELRHYLARKESHGGKPYFRKNMVSNGNWRTVPLMTWGLEYHRTMKYFPETLAVLAKIEDILSISFNILEPGAEISPHFGDTNATYRVHLGLDIPDDLPHVGIRVGDDERGWRTGEILVFCDGYTHAAWNRSNRERYILLLDILRPDFKSRKKEVCSTVLGSLAIQALFGRFTENLISFPKVILFLEFFAKYSAYLLSPVHNKLTQWFSRG